MLKLTNDATTTLAADINSTDTTITLTDSRNFPELSNGEWFPLTFKDKDNIERMRVTARSGDTLTVERGAEGTQSLPWTTLHTCALTLTADAMGEVISGVAAASQMVPLLPEKFPILDGASEQANIYFEYCVKGVFLESNIECSGSGDHLSECVRFESDDLGLSVGDQRSVTISTQDGLRNTISTATTELNVVSKTCATDSRLIVIGDSITRAGAYVKQTVDQLTNCTAQGIRQYTTDDSPREGRGGWSLETYLTNFGHATQGDSPFLFPIGVSGSLYFGNTSQWIDIVADTGAYDHDGFQKIAKDWDFNGAYQYDAVTGRRINPPTGAVMIDPAVGEYIEYNGSSWVTMSPQPSGFEISFEKYLQRFAVAFTDGDPTHVSIMSGANDFYIYDEVSDVKWEEYKGYLNQIINSIHDYSASINVLVSLPIGGGTQDGSAAFNGMNVSSYQYNSVMHELSTRLLDEYDNDTNRGNNVYIAPLFHSLDPVGGWPYVAENRNKYTADIQINRGTELLHPRDEGHYQMGDCLAAVVSYSS